MRFSATISNPHAHCACTRLGPYEVLDLAGGGGMGEVYRARDTRLGRIVALKMITDAIGDDPHVRHRFEREARAIGALNHPNICAVHDVGTHDGRDFLVMEYVDGHTLAERLHRGPLKPPELLTVAIEVAEALVAGASRGDHPSGSEAIQRDAHAQRRETGRLRDRQAA